MSWRGVTWQTRAASAAESRSREMTSPSFATRTCARAVRPSVSATFPPWPGCLPARGGIVSSPAQRVNGPNTWRLLRHALPVGDLHGGPVGLETPLLVEIGPQADHLDGDRGGSVVLG